MDIVLPFQPSVYFHIETSHLICSVNQMIGFSVKMQNWATIGLIYILNKSNTFTWYTGSNK